MYTVRSSFFLKVFVGQEIIHIAVFKKNDDRTVYNLIYRDGKSGKSMVKRFSVLGVTRDKEYMVTKGTPDSKVLYFSANPNGEAEIVRVELKPKPRLKKTSFDFDFSTVSIKGRNSIGNILSRNPVRKIEHRQEGVSTLSSRKIWYDDTVKRLNSEERGILLGDFSGNDRILTIMQSGHHRLTSFDLSTHFDEDMIRIEKYDPGKIFTVVYQEPATKMYYLKRFKVEPGDKKTDFIGDEDQNRMILITSDPFPKLEILFDRKAKTKGAEKEDIFAHEFIGVKSCKAKGKRLTTHPVKKINLMEDQGTRGPGDEGTMGPEDQGTRGPEDRKTADRKKKGEMTKPETKKTKPMARDVKSTPRPRKIIQGSETEQRPKPKRQKGSGKGSQMELPL